MQFQQQQAISPPVQKRAGLWDRFIHRGQHTVFRVVSLVFSAVSAWAIYWFFSALGSDSIQQIVTIATSAGFVVLGYFVTRGLAYRLMNKLPVRSYVFIGVLYLLVEVTCNFGHAVARYPEVTWIHQLHGWQFQVFSFLLPVVLSIIPLFNLFLARIDVDLMAERGAVPTLVGKAQPKQAPPTMVLGSQTQGAVPTMGMQPQASYPTWTGTNTAANATATTSASKPQRGGNGSPNALQQYWNHMRGVKAQQQAQAQAVPQPMPPMSMNGALGS